MPVPIRKLVVDTTINPTQDTYDALQKAYDFYNWKLFNDELPNCLMTLQRKNGTYGYFCPSNTHNDDGCLSDEIALNPSFFPTRPIEETLSTLVHEQVHLWQSHFGTPGRARYHNREWANKMITVGLQPTSTGAVGGRETGDKMTHFILPFGRFAVATEALINTAFKIPWTQAIIRGDQDDERKTKNKNDKNGKRVKYTCPICQLNMWGQHNAKIDCHNHKILMPPSP